MRWFEQHWQQLQATGKKLGRCGVHGEDLCSALALAQPKLKWDSRYCIWVMLLRKKDEGELGGICKA
jgi:hypothetical protein